MILQVPVKQMASVLLAAGSGYANSLTTSLGEKLQATGRVSTSLLLHPRSAGRPAGQVQLEETFERVNTLPEPILRPRRFQDLAVFFPRMAGVFAHDCIRPMFLSADAPRMTIRDALTSRYFAALVPRLVGEGEIVNWQSAEPDSLTAFLSVPKSTKTVLSFWGSDLLRCSGTRAYALQQAACARADRLTVCSLEFAEILQAKFGRDLAPKIRIAMFGSPLLDQIDTLRLRPSEFRRRHNISADDKIICVGINGSPSNRHLEIISLLGRLPEHHKRQFVATMLMTYGCREGYVEQVRQSAAAAGIRTLILDKSLDGEEIAHLRLATDVLVYTPVSDALSQSVSETFYAGGILVTGAWLPYGPWRRCGLHFHEVGQMADITHCVATILDDFQSEKSTAEAQVRLVEGVARWELVINAWVEIYEELAAAGVTT